MLLQEHKIFQILCEKGHHTLEEHSCKNLNWIKDWRCPKCNKKAVWYNIATTKVTKNGVENTYVDLDVNSIKYCEFCQSVLEVTFKIPENKGNLIKDETNK